MECGDRFVPVDYEEDLSNFYIHVCLNPIEFTAGDFYTINYNLLASVS